MMQSGYEEGLRVDAGIIYPKWAPIGKQSNPGSHRLEFSDKKGEFSCRIFQNQENFGF